MRRERRARGLIPIVSATMATATDAALDAFSDALKRLAPSVQVYARHDARVAAAHRPRGWRPGWRACPPGDVLRV